MLPLVRKGTYFPNYADNYFGKDLLSSFFNDGADYTTPAVNIKENDTNFEIEVAAPGLNKEDFKVNLEKNILSISSEDKKDEKEVKDNFMRREFSFNSFSRSFSVPDSINKDKISASHKNGILKIELPKMDEAKTKLSKTIKIS